MWLEYICMFCYITYMYIPHSPITSGGPFLSDGPPCSSPLLKNEDPALEVRWRVGWLRWMQRPTPRSCRLDFESSPELNQWPFQEEPIDPSGGFPNHQPHINDPVCGICEFDSNTISMVISGTVLIGGTNPIYFWSIFQA